VNSLTVLLLIAALAFMSASLPSSSRSRRGGTT
jgi:hypothetical protein